MKTIPFAEKQTVIILAPFISIKALPRDIKLMINKIWIKLPALASPTCFNVLLDLGDLQV